MLCVAAAVASGGCGGESDGDGGRGGAADPAMKRLEAACRTYRGAVDAELPPASPADYAGYLRERRRLVDRFLAVVRKAPSEGAARAVRGRLLAAASQIQGVVNDTQRTAEPRSLAGGLYERGASLEAVERNLDRAASRADVRCAGSAAPSGDLREFRRKAGEVCASSGRAKGVPRLDAGMIRRRVDGHARLKLPSDATRLERDTLAAERALARVAAHSPASEVIRDADARYVALATRTSTGWSRQGVTACAGLPLPQA